MRAINLNGPDGNAFALMGYARSWGKQCGLTRDEIDAITAKMREGDYQHLLTVFQEAFPFVEFLGDPRNAVTCDGPDDDEDVDPDNPDGDDDD